MLLFFLFLFFFFQAEDGIRDLTVTGVQTCAFRSTESSPSSSFAGGSAAKLAAATNRPRLQRVMIFMAEDRKSTRLNSSHSQISYAVFCLKKKTKKSKCPSR